MKVALVCDDLIYKGGHENIIKQMCRIFPQAPLYTTFVSKDWQEYCKKNNIQVVKSFMQKLPLVEKLNRYYAPFLLHIIALESFNFDEYDLVVSVSSRFCHGIITKPKTLHICYMSTVGRMFWEPFGYFEYEKSGVFNFLKKLTNTFLAIPLSYIRLWDRAASERVDFFIANSKTTMQRIKKYYNRNSEIIYPFIDFSQIRSLCTKYENKKSEGYFVVLSRLVAWKRTELAIAACRELNKKLKIIGSGPDTIRLKKIAGNDQNIEFTGFVSFEKKIEILSGCDALINTQKEDFGITILEALACGKPVIAFGKGGAIEIIEENKHGEFFCIQNKDSLKNSLLKFNPAKYNNNDCTKRANEFDTHNFNVNILRYMKSCQDAYGK